MMKRTFKKVNSGILILLLVLLVSGCAAIRGNTVEDKRLYVLDMRDNVLKELYAIQPMAKLQVKNSAGYGVFSNINSHILLLSTANGYGVITDNLTGRDTYMKMFGLGGGLGLGVKDFRGVIIFRKGEDMLRFIEQGWDFHGQFDAVAMSGEKGGGISSARSFDLDIITYQLTEAGIALQAALQGTKFWRYDDLN